MQFSSATVITLAALLGLGDAWRVQLYDNQGFTGGSKFVTGQAGHCSDTNGFNDRTSSIKGDAQLTCYYYKNGGCSLIVAQTAPGAKLKTVPGDANDDISSVKCG